MHTVRINTNRVDTSPIYIMYSRKTDCLLGACYTKLTSVWIGNKAMQMSIVNS